MLQELRVVTALGGVLPLEKDVRVAVDQPGQDGPAGEVDLGRARGNLRGGRVAHGLDPIATDDDDLVAPRGRGPAVDERARADDRDGVGPGGRLREGGDRREERETPDQSRSAGRKHHDLPFLPNSGHSLSHLGW